MPVTSASFSFQDRVGVRHEPARVGPRVSEDADERGLIATRGRRDVDQSCAGLDETHGTTDVFMSLSGPDNTTTLIEEDADDGEGSNARQSHVASKQPLCSAWVGGSAG